MTDRLLIMDDEADFSGFVRKVAEGVGYEVRTTTSPGEFRQWLHEWHPSHIALDLVMPEADGVEMLRILAEAGSRARIVIMSGFDARVVDAARRLGMERGLDIVGTLQKPVRLRDLRSLLENNRQEDDAVSEASLGLALAGGRIEPFYQPKVDLHSWRPVGFEALVRWRHARLGTLGADDFVPMAESSGQIDALSHVVTTHAIAQAQDWQKQGIDVEIAINLSARNLTEESLADRIDAQCRNSGVRRDRIAFEITETAAMADPVRGLDILTRLRLKGFRLSIDDFGTGYSSLVQLHRLPFSELKIDRSFVRECDRSTEARVIVKTMVDLAHNLGMSVVGEGVESDDIACRLAELGCDVGQGFAIARPMEAIAVPAWLTDWPVEHPTGLAKA